MSNDTVERGATSHLTQELDALRKENEELKHRLNRLEVQNIRTARSALYNLGFALPESDEELMQEWPSFLKFMVRRVANLKQISV